MSTTLITASAGTGKTHIICDLIADRLIGGLDPARLVATTFTRKAAAELAERIRARVQKSTELSADRRDALLDRLDLAAIGTVHGIAHRFLCRHALKLGLSPRLEVLDEGEDAGTGMRHLGKLLQERLPACWEKYTAVCDRLSLGPADHVALTLLQATRANAIPAIQAKSDLLASVQRWSGVIGSPDVHLPGIDSAKAMAAAALQRLGSIADATKVTKEAIESLRSIAQYGIWTWSDAAKLATLAAGKKSGADAHLEELRSLGRGARRSPALHADLNTFAVLVGEVVEHLDLAYTAYKRERGLVDFVDLERLFLELVREPTMRTTLAAEISCFIVDEFQDTNPIQLAIFRALHAVAGETVWVGDRKQAIFGFRGTDAELVDGVWRSISATPQTLAVTYRNAPAIVRCVNDLFIPVFGEEARVTAKWVDAPGLVENWTVSGNKAATMDMLAGGIVSLMNENHTIRRRDVAILVRSNHRAGAVAESLHRAGITAIVPLPGLLKTREGASLLAGLRVVADRYDTLACAELQHILDTDPAAGTPAWFHRRIAEVAAAEDKPPFSGVACIDALAALNPSRLSAPDLALTVIAALDLPSRIAGWGAPQGRAANLDALVELAQAFEDEVRQEGRPATPSGLVRFLSDLRDKDADTIPVPPESDAVQIITYHKAKGLEWPVTICFDLDASPKPRMFSPSVDGGNPASVDPLAGRTLKYWPWPFGFNERSQRPNDYGSGLLDAALTTDEGRRQVSSQSAEERRLLYVGCTRARSRLVLVRPIAGAEWLEGLGAHATTALAPQDGGIVTRTCLPATASSLNGDRAMWMSELPRVSTPIQFAARTTSPSSAVHAISTQVAEQILTGVSAITQTGPGEANLIGSAIHAYLAGIDARAHLNDAARLKMANEALSAWGVGGCLAAANLARSADCFLAWIKTRWPHAVLHTEVPAEGPRQGGGFWNGIIDVLIQSPQGNLLAIIDHKSTGGATATADSAVEHGTQLAAYQQAIGQPVELWVHQVMAGRVVRVEVGNR